MINYLNDITFSFVTIIGFSKSKISKNNEKDYGIECNSLYAMAPEAKNVRFNNEKIDIWGFGVMLLEMIN
jgi:serine/threonine protein kinase